MLHFLLRQAKKWPTSGKGKSFDDFEGLHCRQVTGKLTGREAQFQMHRNYSNLTTIIDGSFNFQIQKELTFMSLWRLLVLYGLSMPRVDFKMVYIRENGPA